jgi:hypothetical protein
MAHNTGDLPRINVSLSRAELARLERLKQVRREGRASRVLADAVIHMLASIELQEPIHYTVPSEQEEGR